MRQFSKKELTAQADYLRSPSVIKQMRSEGTLPAVVSRLIARMQAAKMDVPDHVTSLAFENPTITKALATLDLIKGNGGIKRDEVATGKIQTEEGSEAPAQRPQTKTKEKMGPPGMATHAEPSRKPTDGGADSGGEAVRSPLEVYDRFKGLEIVENPTGDDVFGAYEEWKGTTHFAKPLVNLADKQENGSEDEEVHFYGLKTQGKWAGFIACNYADGVHTIRYLETNPELRESVEGIGTRLLAQMMTGGDDGEETVRVNAITETASYFKAAGAKHLGGTRYEFGPEESKAIVEAFLGLSKLQKSTTAEQDGYERRKQAKKGVKAGTLNMKAVFEAEKKLKHGLLIGPVHEAASARVSRYYDPKSGTNVSKSLNIMSLSKGRGG